MSGKWSDDGSDAAGCDGGSRSPPDRAAVRRRAQVDRASSAQALDGEALDRDARQVDRRSGRASVRPRASRRRSVRRRRRSATANRREDGSRRREPFPQHGHARPAHAVDRRAAEVRRRRSWSTALGRAILELQPREAGVEAAARAEARVRAFLDDPAAVHHDDAVGRADGRQAVRDDDRRAVAPSAGRARPAPAARFRRRARRSLRRASSKGASRSSARAIAMRWRWPPDSRAPPSPMNVSSPSGSARRNSSALASRAACHSCVVARVPIAVAQIVARARGEDHRFLRHHRDALANVGGIGVAQVDAVEQHAPAAAGRRSARRAGRWSSCPRPTDRRPRAARAARTARVKSFSADVSRPRRIVEGDVLERRARRAPARAASSGSAGARMSGSACEQFGQALGCARGAQQVAIDFGQVAERAGEKAAVEHEGGDRAAGHPAGGDVDRALPR